MRNRVVIVILLSLLLILSLCACGTQPDARETDTQSGSSESRPADTAHGAETDPETPPESETGASINVTVSYRRESGNFRTVTGILLPDLPDLEAEEFPYEDGASDYCFDITGGTNLTFETYTVLETFFGTALGECDEGFPSGDEPNGRDAQWTQDDGRWVQVMWDAQNRAIYINTRLIPPEMDFSYLAAREQFKEVTDLQLPVVYRLEADRQPVDSYLSGQSAYEVVLTGGKNLTQETYSLYLDFFEGLFGTCDEGYPVANETDGTQTRWTSDTRFFVLKRTPDGTITIGTGLDTSRLLNSYAGGRNAFRELMDFSLPAIVGIDADWEIRNGSLDLELNSDNASPDDLFKQYEDHFDKVIIGWTKNSTDSDTVEYRNEQTGAGVRIQKDGGAVRVKGTFEGEKSIYPIIKARLSILYGINLNESDMFLEGSAGFEYYREEAEYHSSFFGVTDTPPDYAANWTPFYDMVWDQIGGIYFDNWEDSEAKHRSFVNHQNGLKAYVNQIWNTKNFTYEFAYVGEIRLETLDEVVDMARYLHSVIIPMFENPELVAGTVNLENRAYTARFRYENDQEGLNCLSDDFVRLHQAFCDVFGDKEIVHRQTAVHNVYADECVWTYGDVTIEIYKVEDYMDFSFSGYTIRQDPFPRPTA